MVSVFTSMAEDVDCSIMWTETRPNRPGMESFSTCHPRMDPLSAGTATVRLNISG